MQVYSGCRTCSQTESKAQVNGDMTSQLISNESYKSGSLDGNWLALLHFTGGVSTRLVSGARLTRHVLVVNLQEVRPHTHTHIQGMLMTTFTRRRPPLVAEICGELSRRIRTGHYSTGRTLAPERELANELGVSRPVVREALGRLEGQGLVDVRHGVGVVVVNQLHRPLSDSLTLLLPEAGDRLRQLASARMLLEPQVASLAAQQAKASDLRALRDNQKQLQSCNDVLEAMDLDLCFHQLLAKASGNDVIVLMLDGIADLGRESRRTTLDAFGVTRAHEQHQRILKAVEKHDPAAAAVAMRDHLDAVAADLLACKKSKSQQAGNQS